MNYHISVRVMPDRRRWRSDTFTDPIIADLAFYQLVKTFRDATDPIKDVELKVMLVANGIVVKTETIKRNGKEQ